MIYQRDRVCNQCNQSSLVANVSSEWYYSLFLNWVTICSFCCTFSSNVIAYLFFWQIKICKKNNDKKKNFSFSLLDNQYHCKSDSICRNWCTSPNFIIVIIIISKMQLIKILHRRARQLALSASDRNTKITDSLLFDVLIIVVCLFLRGQFDSTLCRFAIRRCI